MGLTKGGELVRNVFFPKNKSSNENHHDQAQERRKWSKMRSYLCGDEFNSVLAEQDSDSCRSYSAVISPHPPPPLQNSSEEPAMIMMDSTLESSVEKQSSTADLFRQEDAAITIQTSFRTFLARQRRSELDMIKAEESIATSLEVQTGNSVEKLAKKKSRSSSSPKVKEDWDDSKVSSNISKKRIQNRVEAMTRRERALAYAFSQQLRLCSKKKPINNNTEAEETSADMAWSWLERWMATRLPVPENSYGNSTDQSLMRKRLLEIAIEERESCGSNEVSSTLQIDQSIAKNRVKPPRTVPLPRKKVNKKEVKGMEN